jgi:hypothetical protein
MDFSKITSSQWALYAGIAIILIVIIIIIMRWWSSSPTATTRLYSGIEPGEAEPFGGRGDFNKQKVIEQKRGKGGRPPPPKP